MTVSSVSTAASALSRQLPVPLTCGPFGAVIPVTSTTELAADQIRQAYLRLFAWSLQARHAYSDNTILAWQSDWRAFSRFCLSRGFQPLPASPATVSHFIAWHIELGSKPATIERALATIARAHRAAEAANPCENEVVRLARKAMRRALPVRQDQARGLTWAEIERALALPVRYLRDHRDRALIAVAYDTMCRCNEVVSFDVEDFQWMPDGSGVVLIRRAKNDPEGQGALAYLSPETVQLVKNWFAAAHLRMGAAFRIIVGKNGVGERLRPTALADRIRRLGEWVGLPTEDREALSGHSSRVGATQDLLALNIELPAVMQAGRWKDARMVTRYGERILAARGAMARAAKAQGRA